MLTVNEVFSNRVANPPVAAVFRVFALLIAFAGFASAAGFRAPLMKRPPRIDGRIDPGEWAVSLSLDGFGMGGGELRRRRARGYVGATEHRLFVAIRSQLPDEGDLLANVTRHSAKAVYDAAVEVFVNPTPDSDAQVEYQMLVNSIGKGSYHTHTVGGAKEDAGWRGGWKQSHGFHRGEWHFECEIPIESMGSVARGRKTTDGAWAVNLTRDWKAPWEWSSLSAAEGGYAFSGVRVAFDDRAPAVHHAFSSDPFLANFDAMLTLHNPTQATIVVKARQILERNRMPTVRLEESLTLEAGESRSVKLVCPPDEATTRFKLHARVTFAASDLVFFDRAVTWPRGKPTRYVAGRKEKPAPVQFRFAYYPYRSRLRLLADINGLSEDATLTELTAEIRRREKKTVIHRVAFDVGCFREGRQEITIQLPPLEGDYEIALRAKGKNVPDGEMVKRFERRVFPWEHTPVGRSTKVFPPFTPIAVDAPKKTLRTVLREHELNDVGLWRQVRATSAHTGVTRPVLSEGMRYVAVVDGRSVPVVVTKPLTIVKAAPHEVTTASAFTVGAIPFSVRTTWDYDGTARVELTLGGMAGERLDELTLEIPFDAIRATLLHASADRIRQPVAERISSKNGLVWDGSRLACDDLTRNFCPYVYVGDAVRGLCWFADNDRGWSWNHETPNTTLVRDDSQVVLRVHLVNKPLTSTRPRKIVFGLLAAPVKPRLSPGGKHGWRYRYYRDGYTLLGTDINWLARGNCGSVYPAGKDLYLWEMIARGNREKLSQGEVDAVIRHGRKYFEPYGEERVKSFEAHVRHNLLSRFGKKMIFYYNRASYQRAEEFETFKDEWGLTDLRSVPKGKGLGEIKIVPSESYIDHALYWYARSFEIGGNRGVYWDNFFIAPSFNTEMTDSYARPESGDIVPAAGIWALRELAKRTFVLMNERGMRPITFAHMTSFNPLPMMSFCTVQYDWEWKYSLGDVQDRHTRELILLTSTGDLAGVWPVPLGDHGKLASDPWTQRTFTAVRLVHELDGYGGFGSPWVKSHVENRKKLFEPIHAMLDDPNLEVYRYWDERPQPVASADPDIVTIVYAVRGKEALAVVTSYAPDDRDVSINVDRKTLGLGAAPEFSNAETGAAMPRDGDGLVFSLPRHDVRLIRLTSRGGGR